MINAIDCHVHLRRGTGSVEEALRVLDRDFSDLPIEQVMVIDLDGVYLADPIRWERALEPLKISVGMIPIATPENIERIVEIGDSIHGIKIHPRMQQIPIISRFMESVVECARQIRKPVVIDTLLQSSSIHLRDLDPYRYDDLAKENQDVTFVLAHSCWPRLLDGYILARSNENIYLDLSYFAGVGGGTGMVADFSTLLSTLDQKVLYGSDYPSVHPSGYFSGWLERLHNLDEVKRNNIFLHNACQVFGS